jgi:polyketide biosynthesis enoyl-CoA hydratase PksI
VTATLFEVTHHGDGIVSLCIATDDDPYLGPQWVARCATALAEVADDVAARVVMLTGDGRYFSAGASRQALTNEDERGALLDYVARAAPILLGTPVPIIAAATGHAIGGGLLVALWCDVIALAEESLYGVNFMQLGFTPGMGATHVVQEAFGGPLGRELLFTGRLVTGREILDARCPLSHAVLPRAHVMDRALSIARTIADAPRQSVVRLKRNLAERRHDGLERVLQAEAADHAHLFADPAISAEIRRRYPIPNPPANIEAS